MFANPTKVGISQRVVATLVASAMVLWSIGAYTTAQAANLVDVSNTLTDSNPGSTSGHTFQFEVPAGVGSAITATDLITITFPTVPDSFGSVATVVAGDLTVQVDGGLAIDVSSAFASGASSIAFDDVAATAGQVVTVAIAEGIITNPATVESYEFEIDVANANTDIGKTRVAIIDNVLVTAVVDTVFDFTITGVATSTTVNGTSTTGSTTPTAINFGTLVANEIKTLAQRLNVTTNANNGFVVTVETDGDLESSNGAIIDNFDEGIDVNAPGTTWNAPVPTIGNPLSWGHWGLTSGDSDVGSLGGVIYGGVDFGANEYIAATTTPREIFHHDGPSDGTTTDIGSSTVAYQIQITSLQEAADDYNTTLTYIATPTF